MKISLNCKNFNKTSKCMFTLWAFQAFIYQYFSKTIVGFKSRDRESKRS